MVRKEYSAGGVKHPFWFLEFKKAAILRDQGVTWEGLRTRSREENLFSAASPARAEMTCNTVAARMQTLPDSFLPMFVFGDPATQKLFCRTEYIMFSQIKIHLTITSHRKTFDVFIYLHGFFPKFLRHNI